MRTILSIDGGGVRGIIPLACLVRLESRLGRPCREIFDMAAGTSTGAGIAAGIALGVSARGLPALYRELATEAFQRLPWWQVVLNRGNHRYRLDFVARLLTEMGAPLPLTRLPPRASSIDWGFWVLDELLGDSADWQTYITRREYGMGGRLDFRRYQIDLSPAILADRGVRVPPGGDLAQIGMDAVWAVGVLGEIGRGLAAPP